ncbi:MAG: hypothetical protein UY92_C0014G0011 [Candidatus Magasanikbacteria bacterium GW2011_GWA2_56_11]|uniref:Uncharacterized protein n=1 Tax=Candidatus Magasanikbacteria bacterium GW2011_GWA2_56_11 TaxID=1619044 RepID=A0A0G1YEP5_9BACT|nr:MAG: hypothetical protein UY92_C0014G0011 [Candidatus Magasanikbacteria bacterium GW2011_GWA2_56_11]
MSEKLLLHLIALAATLITGLAYTAGYVSGTLGWWWTVIAVLGVYAIIIKLLGGGHH